MLIGSSLWVGSLVGHGSNVSFSVKIHFIFIGFSGVSNNYILIPTAGERRIQLEHFYLFSPPWSLSNQNQNNHFLCVCSSSELEKVISVVVSSLDTCGNAGLCSCQSSINTTLFRNGSIMIRLSSFSLVSTAIKFIVHQMT